MIHDTGEIISEFLIKAIDELDKVDYKAALEADIQESCKKGIELSQEEIKRLEGKYYQEYMNSGGRNLSNEDRIKYLYETGRIIPSDNEKEKKQLKKQHSIDNLKNFSKSYNIEKKLCKKYLIDKSDKIFLLTTEIREIYSKTSLLKFIRLMYIYEKALDLGLTNKGIEEVFDEQICERYKEYEDCFEDVRKVIMEFSTDI